MVREQRRLSKVVWTASETRVLCGRPTVVRPSIAAMRLAGEASSAVEGWKVAEGTEGVMESRWCCCCSVVVKVEGGSVVIGVEKEAGRTYWVSC